LKFPIVFKRTGKDQKKLRKNGNFYAKSILEKLILNIGVTLKLITVKT